MADPGPNLTQRWLARLAFAFFAIAFFLVWEALHVHERTSSISPQVRQILCFAGALAAFGLGMMGVRARHQ